MSLAFVWIHTNLLHFWIFEHLSGQSQNILEYVRIGFERITLWIQRMMVSTRSSTEETREEGASA
jgi:hypothetical protein